MKIGVVGAGSWGTALAKVVSEKGHEVLLLARRPEIAEVINHKHENPAYLPGITLPPQLRASTDPEDLKAMELIFWVVPCQSLRQALKTLRPYLNPRVPMISAIKGLEIESGKTPLEVLREFFPENRALMALSGPNFALEVARRLPTATVLAGEDEDSVRNFQEALSLPYLRIYRSSDVRGVELCGALKNIIAIAAGISDGLGLGLNARAALITRGLMEIMRLGLKLGAKAMTFSGLAGLGDLVLTCTGKLSRNYTVGFRLGKGEKLSEILRDLHQVAEGLKTVLAVKKLSAKHRVEMPISEGVYRILYEEESPEEALRKLLSRPLKAEFEVLPL